MFSIEKVENLPKNDQVIKVKEMQNILDTIKMGNLLLIQSTLSKYEYEMKFILDRDNHQNAYFYASLIPSDQEALIIFKYLFSLGVDAFCKDKNNQTCLYYSSREGKYLVCKYLIQECNLPVNEKDIFGQTPIYYACREGRLDVVKLLIDSGSNINLDDNYGQTCLFYAVKQNHLDVVQYLVEKGINVNKIDKMNSSPLTLSEKLKDGKITQYLIEHGSVRQEVKPRKRHLSSGYKKILKKKVEMRPRNPEMSKDEVIANIQKPRRYILLRVKPNGEKIPLTAEEIQTLKINYPDISKLLDDKNALYSQVSELSTDLLVYESWEKQAKRLLGHLWRFKESSIFHQPVNPVELGIPDYFQIVKKPMDFSTIKKKLREYQYTNFKEFCGDINLVFDNCITYNGANSQVGQLCEKVKQEFQRLFTLLKMDKFL